MINNLFKVPFGFYNENVGFVSKKSQIEDLLDSINADAESNAQMDAEQSEKIAANTEAISQEVERSSGLDSKFEADLATEVSERKRMGDILNSKISDLDTNLRALVEETDKGFDVVAEELRKKDEALDAKDVELTSAISNEALTRQDADNKLSEAIKVNLSQFDELSNNVNTKLTEIDYKVSEVEKSVETLNVNLSNEISLREKADNLLTEKVNTLVSSVQEVYDYAKTKDAELEISISNEVERAKSVEEAKVDWVDLGNNRKAIVLKNHDLLLGTDTAGSTSNIAMISKWDIVDLGTTSLPINLNTPKGVRPTVQEAGQSGEEAHKIAYLSDVENANGNLSNQIKIEEERAKSAENLLEERIDSSVLSLNSSISNMNSTLAILSSTDTALNSRLDVVDSSLSQFKANGVELKQMSALQYVLYVDGVNRGTIDIPKDNFLTNVYLTDNNKLHFVFNVSDVQTDIEVDIAKYIDIYTAGKGLSLDKNQFSVVINKDSEGYLSVSDNGLSINGIYEEITSAVSVETNRAMDIEKSLKDDLIAEINKSKDDKKELLDLISSEENRAKAAENVITSRLIKVENYEPTILNNSSKIQVLGEQIIFEESRAKTAEETLANSLSNEASLRESKDNLLSQSVDLLTTSIKKVDEEYKAAVANEASLRESKDNLLSQSVDLLTTSIKKVDDSVKKIDGEYKSAIAEEASLRESKDNLLSQSVDLLTTAIKKVDENYKAAIKSESERAMSVESKKVDLVDLGGDRKAIVLKNHDLLLGTDTAGSTSNIAMISKWDVVDLGSVSLPINLNTPSGVRPTVQEAGQSGEEAHKIAYLSDVDAVKAEIPTIPTKVSAFENDANYLTEHQDLSEYAKLSDIPSLDGYATEQWVSEQGYLTEHQDLSEYAKLSDIESLMTLISELQDRIKTLESNIYSSDQLLEAINNLKEGETLDLKLYNGIIISESNKMQIPQGATLNLNLNGNTIVTEFADILFRVNGTLNISGEGTFAGKSYVASANVGGVVNVLNGTFESNITAFQANGGIINIEDGYFTASSETYGAKFLLNHVDKMKNDGLISVKGGTFVNYNPEMSYSENPPMNFVADGYGVIENVEGENHIYRVIKTNKVNNNTDFVSLINSLNDDKETLVELSEDITIDDTFEKMIVNGNVTLDLNGKTLTFTKEDILFRVNGILNIYGGTIVSNSYVASANEGGTINVLNGTYDCDVTCFQSNGGVINISGGYFSACNDTYGCKYTLNFIDSMKNIGKINVSGGSFVGYNPSVSDSENPPMNFVVDGYKTIETIENDLVVFTVVKI